jgi:serine beta-lactamase-like protein LACTB, mitochondrial
MTAATIGIHLMALWVAAIGSPPAPPAASHPAVDQAMAALMEEQQIVGLAIGVVREGRTELLAGYGMADLEVEVPVDPARTVFRWASISKSLTAIVATRLLRAGALDLEDPIDRWWDGYPVPATYLVPCKRRQETIEVDGAELPCEDGFADAPVPEEQRTITLEHLLTHTSGILGFKSPRGWPYPKARTLNDPATNLGLAWGLQRMADKPLMAIPGTTYGYSTFGYNLAAIVMEQASGRPFPELVDAMIADPLGMDSLQPDYEWVEIPDRAAGYRIAKRGRDRVKRERSWDVSWKMAGGGFVSTPADLARFCGALMGDQLLDPADKALLWTERTTTTGEPTEYGMGFALATRDGRRVVEHAGVQPKARTRLRLYPDEDLCIVVVSNTTTAKTGAIADAVEAAWTSEASVSAR